MNRELDFTEKSLYEWLDLFRAKPGLYFGVKSLERLYIFIQGMKFGLADNGKDLKGYADFHRFHDWTAKKLGFYESTSGWYNMIRSKCADEAEAFDRFYALLDQFRAEPEFTLPR